MPVGGPRVLRHASFRLLIAGELVSNFGDGTYLVALPWYVLSQHGGALLLGAVLTAYGVPRTALLVVGGHASDRYGPWSVMLAANCARGLAVAVLAVTTAVGSAHALLLILIAVFLGLGRASLFLPRRRSSLLCYQGTSYRPATPYRPVLPSSANWRDRRSVA